METQTLFMPVIFVCTEDDSYKKIQSPITILDKHNKLFDKIAETFGFYKMDEDTFIQPVMQLYNPVDFSNREIDLNLEIFCELAYKNIKESTKFLQIKKPVVSIIYTSTGEHREEIKPMFKSLIEIQQSSKATYKTNNSSISIATILHLLLPIVVCHHNSKKLNESIDFVLEYQSTDEKMEELNKHINEYYGLKDCNSLRVLPICHADFIGEEFELISKSFEDEISVAEGVEKEKPYINENKINRNDLCPCGSGKKYKKCCIYKLN